MRTQIKWVNEGQRFTCQNGHTIAIATELVEIGSEEWLERFIWIYDYPEFDDYCECPRCYGVWFIRRVEPIWKRLPWWIPLYREIDWICIDGMWSGPLTPEVEAFLRAREVDLRYRRKEAAV